MGLKEEFERIKDDLTETEWRRFLVSAISDLKSAETQVETEVTAVQTALTDFTAEVVNLKAIIAGATSLSPDDSAAIEAVVTRMDTAVTNLQTAAASDPGPQAAPTPVAVQAFDPGTNLALYAYNGSGFTTGAPWTQVTDVTASDGSALYTNSSDTAGQPPTAANFNWVAYTGTLLTVTPPA